MASTFAVIRIFSFWKAAASSSVLEEKKSIQSLFTDPQRLTDIIHGRAAKALFQKKLVRRIDNLGFLINFLSHSGFNSKTSNKGIPLFKLFHLTTLQASNFRLI